LGNDVKTVIDDVEIIALLPCWERSRGARLEVYAGLMYGREFAYFDRTAATALYAVSRDLIRSIIKRTVP
jgi:hypothetical protein